MNGNRVIEVAEFERAGEHGEVRRGYLRSLVQPAVSDPAHREQLNGPRVERQRLRPRGPLRPPFEHNRPDATPVQFRGEPHADGAAPDDGNIDHAPVLPRVSLRAASRHE